MEIDTTIHSAKHFGNDWVLHNSTRTTFHHDQPPYACPMGQSLSPVGTHRSTQQKSFNAHGNNPCIAPCTLPLSNQLITHSQGNSCSHTHNACNTPIHPWVSLVLRYTAHNTRDILKRRNHSTCPHTYCILLGNSLVGLCFLSNKGSARCSRHIQPCCTVWQHTVACELCTD